MDKADFISQVRENRIVMFGSWTATRSPSGSWSSTCGDEWCCFDTFSNLKELWEHCKEMDC